jgi:hypothetical protein
MEREFSFKREEEYKIKIDEETNMHIKRINERVARLYFTDEEEKKKRIPKGIVVYRSSEKINKTQIEEYLLRSEEEYNVELNKKEVIKIKNEIKWRITGGEGV